MKTVHRKLSVRAVDQDSLSCLTVPQKKSWNWR
jgi:hypothetical protein